MHNNRILILLAVTVVVSGCSQLPTSNQETDSQTPQQVAGKGLEVTEFRVSDQTMTPGQTVTVNLKLKNFHRQEINIGNITLYNLGLLESSQKSCTPDEIGVAQKDIAPVMECSWRITAPDEDIIGGFNQRKSTISANIPYNSTIQNYQPLTVKFLPLDRINRTSKKAISFSNGEVGVNMEVETPVPLQQNKSVDFQVSKEGSGRITGNYSFEYSPSSVFIEESDYSGENDFECPSSDRPVIRDNLDFTCSIRADGDQEVERNLFFTVRYKYIKAPSTGVTIVNN